MGSIINNLTFLYSNEKIIGWFLIGYIPETYYNLSVKFFLINNEFRQLITNFVLVIKNVLSLSYLITFVEFINLILTALFLIFLLFLNTRFIYIKLLFQLYNTTVFYNCNIINVFIFYFVYKYRYYKTLFLFFQFYIVIFLTYYIHTFEIE